MSITILHESDFTEWAAQWRQYLQSNNTEVPESQYRNAFSRILADDGDLHAFVIRDPETAKIVGLSHYTVLPSPWSEKAICWMNALTLQEISDLFVDPTARRKGYGRKLIMATAEAGRKLKCGRLSWVAEKDNIVARSLYDSLASCEHVSYRMLLDDHV